MVWVWTAVVLSVVAAGWWWWTAGRRGANKPLYQALHETGLVPMDRARRNWQRTLDDGVLVTVNTGTRELWVDPSGDGKERLPEVRARRTPWKARGKGPELLTGDPGLDEVVQLHGESGLILSLPSEARAALRRVVDEPFAVQLTAGANRFRWDGAWPPDSEEASRLGQALENLQLWASAAQDPKPVEIRLMRSIREETLPWLRQLCLLVLERDYPDMAVAAPDEARPPAVTESLDALWSVGDGIPPRWRAAVAEHIFSAIPAGKLTPVLEHGVCHGSVGTANFLLRRIAEVDGAAGELTDDEEAVVIASLRHSSETVHATAVGLLGARGSLHAAYVLHDVVESGAFRTPDLVMRARTAIKRIGARNPAAR